MMEVSTKEKELNVVMALGHSLSEKCVEEDGKVILIWLEELHTKWNNLKTQLTQRKVHSL